MGINYRCTDRRACGKRVTLKQPRHFYRNRPMCPECGGDIKSVNAKEVLRGQRRGCFCRGNDWPHVKGRVESENRTCIHADLYDVEVAEFNQDLGIIGSQKVTNKECPF